MGKANSLVIFILVSLLLSKTSSAALPSSVGVPASAISIALLALTISFDVLAIGYVISKVFPQTELSSWLQNEYWETAKSALLIVAIFSAISLLNNVSAFFYQPVSSSTCLNAAPVTPDYNLVNAACSYLSQTNTYLANSFSYFMGLGVTLGALDSLNVGVYLPIPLIVVGFKFGFTADPYQNHLLEADTPGQYESLLNDLIDYIAFPLAMLIYVQSSILPYLFVIGIEVLIPLGLVLRAFPFVRGVGGSVIAVGLALSVIYPAVLAVFNSVVTNALQVSALSPPSTSCGWNILCSALGVIYTIFPGINGVGDGLASIGNIFPALNGIINYNMYLILLFVLFIFDLAIIFSVADAIANMLGGSLRNKLSLGSKLKLA